MATKRARLYAAPRRVDRLEDCWFYTTMEIPGVGLVQGPWDLRDGVDDYLGHVDFSGKRVLEIGPASGFLTFEMERRGAQVVSVEVSDATGYDYIPRHGLNLEEFARGQESFLEKLKNSFWYAHRAHWASSRVHYGNAHDLPDELGVFDVSTMCCVLLHNRDPLRIVSNCARLTREKVIIVDLGDLTMSGPIARFEAHPDNDTMDGWWSFSPEIFTQYLGVLGFAHFDVTFHERPLFGTPRLLFTVVASR